jgi:protein SCO1/2
MTRTLKLTLAALAAIAFGLPVVAAAQGSFRVDANLAKRGKIVYERNGCYMCHGLGVSARRAGPDLLGVTERRDHDWLRRWLKDTNAMLAGDPQARAMLQQWNGVRMPQVKLTDADIDALLHYMAQQTQILRGG